MSAVYDNWERLVAATLKREHHRELALAPPSRDTSFSSSSIDSDLDDFSSRFDSEFASLNPVNVAGTYWKLIKFAGQVVKAADGAIAFKQECLELKSKTERLAFLLHKAARVGNHPYDRPMHRIKDDTNQVLVKVHSLILKCSTGTLFLILPSAAFRKVLSQLENSISNVSWLLKYDHEYRGIPPIVANDPHRCIVWEQITILYTGSVDYKCDAAASLVCLARDSDLYKRLIIEEDGIGPLFKLLQEGNLEGQENAARAIGTIGKDPESMMLMLYDGVCSVLVRLLREGPINVRATTAWAVSELVSHSSECKNTIKEFNIIPSLVRDLSLEVLQENPSIRANLAAMAARAICHLVKDDFSFCQRITETSALLRLSVLLEKGTKEVQINSAMALVEITAVGEKYPDLRKSAFKRNSPPCNVVVDRLLGVIEKEANLELVVPCVKAIGNLAKIFGARETRVVSPLVKLLDNKRDNAEVCSEACIALTKFVAFENFLCVDHSKAVISAGGEKNLVQLVDSNTEQIVRTRALVLLCYIALHVPESYELVEAEALTLLQQALLQAPLMQEQDQTVVEDQTMVKLLSAAVERLIGEFHKTDNW